MSDSVTQWLISLLERQATLKTAYRFFQIERQKFTISFYRSCVYTLCVISQFYTHCVLQIKSYTICVIYIQGVLFLHPVYSFTLSVRVYTGCLVSHSVCSSLYTWCVVLHSVCSFTQIWIFGPKTGFMLFCCKICFFFLIYALLG